MNFGLLGTKGTVRINREVSVSYWCPREEVGLYIYKKFKKVLE